MKKYLSLFLILFALCGFGWHEGETLECTDAKCPGPSYELAMSPVFLGGGGAAAPVIILNETFEGSTACYSGAEGNDATCVVTWKRDNSDATWYHALQAGASADAGTYGVNLVPSADDHRIYWDYGSAVGRTTYNVDVEFTLYVNSATIDDAGYIAIQAWAALSTGTNHGSQLRVYRNSDQLSLVAYSVGGSTPISITTGTHYSIKIHHDTTNTESYITVGETTQSFTRGPYDAQYCSIGSLAEQEALETIDFEIGHMKITIYTD